MRSVSQPVARPRAVFAALLLGVLTACATPTSEAPPTPPKVIATGLNGPQGVYVASDGNVWVADDGNGGASTFTAPGPNNTTVNGTYGETGRLVRVAPDGTATVVTTLLSVNNPQVDPAGGGKIAVLDGNVYVVNGQWNAAYSGTRPAKAAALLRVDGAATVEVANLYAFEQANNPDGVPAAQGGIDTHPYGLAAGPDGQLYVADAGANALLKVNPAGGAVSLVASLAGQTGTGPQSVPTGVAFGRDGSAYVSLLSGGPFPSGAAKVVKVSGGVVSDFATGMTMLTDVKLGPDGNFYAVSFGVFAPGPASPIPFAANAGAIIRISASGQKTTVLRGLNYPTSISFNSKGDAYVAENGLGFPASGRVVRYAGLTRYGAQD